MSELSYDIKLLSTPDLHERRRRLSEQSREIAAKIDAVTREIRLREENGRVPGWQIVGSAK